MTTHASNPGTHTQTPPPTPSAEDYQPPDPLPTDAASKPGLQQQASSLSTPAAGKPSGKPQARGRRTRRDRCTGKQNVRTRLCDLKQSAAPPPGVPPLPAVQYGALPGEQPLVDWGLVTVPRRPNKKPRKPKAVEGGTGVIKGTKPLSHARVRDGTAARLSQWLDVYARCGYQSEACRVTGVSQSTVSGALKRSPEFAAAKLRAEQYIDNTLREAMLRRGRDGWMRPIYQGGKLVGHEPQFSDRLLETLARSRLPEMRDSPALSGGPAVVVRVNVAPTPELSGGARDITAEVEAGAPGWAHGTGDSDAERGGTESGGGEDGGD